jgi:hypothetical protein
MTTPELNTETVTEDTTTTEEQIIIAELDKRTIIHKDEIETVISSLEENDSAMVLENEGGFLWKFEYGSVEVFVQLTGENEDDLFTVWSVVLQLPAKNELELMKKLLEMNWNGTFETCYSIFNNQIVICTQRTIDDLSPAEISRAITLVATIADQNKEELKATYCES